MTIDIESKLDAINIFNYFPTIGGTYREFEMLGEDGIIAGNSTNTVVPQTGRREALETRFVVEEQLKWFPESDPVDIVRRYTYEVTEEKIVLIHSYSSMFGEFDQRVTCLKKAVKWTRDEESECMITDINKKIEIKAGVFENCIEVHERTGVLVTKKYYAQHLGLVLTMLETANNESIVFEEMTGFHIPARQIS